MAGFEEDPYQHSDIHNHHDEESGSKSRKKIWQVFWILFAITAVEFIIAFTVDRGGIRNTTYIALTLVKAFYIVAEFMHLKHEVKNLIRTIIIPLSLVIWLMVALMVDGAFYHGGWMAL